MFKKVQKNKPLSKNVCSDGWIVAQGYLQKSLEKIKNPFVTGLEGFFVLESLLDVDCNKILEIYKKRDKAEKLIRDLKEEAELRPFRHLSDNAVKGGCFACFSHECVSSFDTSFEGFFPREKLEVTQKILD